MQLKILILYFFLLILRILLNLYLDTGYKQNWFCKILLEKNFKFSQNKKSVSVAFYLSLMLLSAKINFFPKKQGCKKDILAAYYTVCVKIILVLLTKVVILHMQVFIVYILGFLAWKKYLQDPISQVWFCFNNLIVATYVFITY